jgi:hypothetical protein
MANLTTDQVYNRLRSLASVDVSTTIVTEYITKGDIWLELKLAQCSLTLTSLTDSKQSAAKYAELAWVAQNIINQAPRRKVKKGPIEINPIGAAELKEINDRLDKEIKDFLELAGCATNAGFAGDFGVDGYDSSWDEIIYDDE